MRRVLAVLSSAMVMASLGLAMPPPAVAGSSTTDIEVTVDDNEIMVIAHRAGAHAAGDIVVEVVGGQFQVSLEDPTVGAQLWSEDAACTPASHTLTTVVTCTLRTAAEPTAYIDLEGIDEAGAAERTFEVKGDIDTTFIGSAFDDTFFGGEGDDIAIGQEGADSLSGGGGSDEMIGGAGPDSIDVFDDGGSGPDMVDCNDEGSRGTDNDSSGENANSVDYDDGVDTVTDCPAGGQTSTTGVRVYSAKWTLWGTDLNLVALMPVPGLKQAAITASRRANALVISDDDGLATLTIDPPSQASCDGDAEEPPYAEVTCTFAAPTPGTSWIVQGSFGSATGPVSFTVDPASDVSGSFTGSTFADTFSGGRLVDYAMGGAGDDTIVGGPGNDQLFGDAGDDLIRGDAGVDSLRGGVGDDDLNGGSDPDSVIGGLDNDTVDARDGAKDQVDCGEPDARRQEENLLTDYDSALDITVDCGVAERPSVVTNPYLDQGNVKVGETLTATSGSWRGTMPIRYSYRFERCGWSLSATPSCSTVKSGILDAKGVVDAKTKRKPDYRATREDQGKFLRYVVLASNAKLKGGGETAVATVSLLVEAPPSVVLDPAAWLPRQVGGTWRSSDANKLRDLLYASAIKPFSSFTWEGVPLKSVPNHLQSAVRTATPIADILDIKVNGKSIPATGKTVVEATPDEPAEITIRYYSTLADRKTCPLSDDAITYLNSLLKLEVWSLPDMEEYLAERGQGCVWRVEWSPEVGKYPFHQVTGVAVKRIEGDTEYPVQLVLTAKAPSTTAGLSLVIGAPPREQVQALPEHFSLTPDRYMVTFPNNVRSSLWVGLMGEQAREGAKFAQAAVYVNGVPGPTVRFPVAVGDKVPFNVTTSLTPRLAVDDAGNTQSSGKVRIVVTTYSDDPQKHPANSQHVVGQVYADFTVLPSSNFGTDRLITWDGRCFAQSGEQGTCPWVRDGALDDMRDVIAKTGISQLSSGDEIDALRRASSEFDRRFTMIVVNSNVRETPPQPSGKAVRYRDCFWLDLICHGSNMIEAVATAVIRPRKPAAAATPPPVVRPQVRVKVITLSSGRPAVAVYGEGTLNLGGYLINLDGGNLINLDGGNLINLDGGNLGPALRAALINLDGSNLINLDGGNLAGIDVSLLRDLKGALLKGFDPASQVRIALLAPPK